MKTPEEGGEVLAQPHWRISHLKCAVWVFPTPGRVVSLPVVKSDRGVGDGHVGVEGAKAPLIRSRNHEDSVWIHGGFEGNLDAL